MSADTSDRPLKHAPPSKSPPGDVLLPVARVQRIVKADADVTVASKEAIFLISKMTECFLRNLTEAAYTTSQLGGRRSLEYRDIAAAVKDDEAYHFLRDIVPTPMRLDEAQQRCQALDSAPTG